jgi:predicted 3-demethylubiquinone-9 3-methyltransferase (glyoxalase superfamily)
MMHQKITLSLWFHQEDGDVNQVVEYYKDIFGESFHEGPVIPLGDTPGGKSSLCHVQLFGIEYALLCTSNEHHSFNDSASLVIKCAGQDEIDMYWDYFTKEGKVSNCGWCQDRWGLSWQIIPENLGELLQRPNGFQVMMGQQKIIINQY